jgi:hypothetical protein
MNVEWRAIMGRAAIRQSQLAADRAGNGRIVVFAALAAVGIVAALVVWMFLAPGTQPSVDVGLRVAEEFLQQVREGHADQAWQSTTAEFKSALGREKFLKYVKERPYLKQPLSFVSTQTVRVQDQPRSELVYRTADSKATVRLLVGPESSQWRIDRMAVDEVK